VSLSAKATVTPDGSELVVSLNQGIVRVKLPIELTNKELAVYKRICIGKATKEIAGELGITERATKFRLTRIFQKLGIQNRHEILSMELTP
jgi:DNA-binding CsgD family transcriptional regulator